MVGQPNLLGTTVRARNQRSVSGLRIGTLHGSILTDPYKALPKVSQEAFDGEQGSRRLTRVPRVLVRLGFGPPLP